MTWRMTSRGVRRGRSDAISSISRFTTASVSWRWQRGGSEDDFDCPNFTYCRLDSILGRLVRIWTGRQHDFRYGEELRRGAIPRSLYSSSEREDRNDHQCNVGWTGTVPGAESAIGRLRDPCDGNWIQG